MLLSRAITLRAADHSNMFTAAGHAGVDAAAAAAAEEAAAAQRQVAQEGAVRPVEEVLLEVEALA
jgi:DNA recombination-dependent growth factor C